MGTRIRKLGLTALVCSVMSIGGATLSLAPVASASELNPTSVGTEELVPEVIQGVPLGVPATPVASVTDCPVNPEWSQPLPQGATISDPFLGPSGAVSLSSGDTAISYDTAGYCEYTVTVPGDPVTYVHVQDTNAPFATVINGSLTNSYGQTCSFKQQAGLYYVAFSSIQNVTGYCNTDSSGYWSSTTIANTAFAQGAIATTNQFGVWAQSSIAGSPFFWSWEVCMQNPIGQHVNYLCAYGNMGPLF